MKFENIRLGVNIDHVATLRQARGEHYPSVVDAAQLALENGADQITIHLREDRRHIQDPDVFAVKTVTDRFHRPLNLELGCADDIIEIASELNADWYCIVPEKREERTTEGGLDLLTPAQFDKVANTCHRLKATHQGCKISLFVEAEQKTLEQCVKLGVDAVEIHTGDYARDFLNNEDLRKHLSTYQQFRSFIKDKDMGYHAGHGLTADSLLPLVENNLFEEYNIGHWIIAQSIFEGLGPVVKKMKDSLTK